MKRALIGCTGFVGSNILSGAKAAGITFDGLYNSKNFKDAYGTHPDLLVYAGMRAEKFIANKHSDLDFASVKQAEETIAQADAATVVLISTIDVYPSTPGCDETTEINPGDLDPYGANRLCLEQWVEANCAQHLIVRLPALFGPGLKKNFLYDLLHPVPHTLNAFIYERISVTEPLIASSYSRDEWGFYKLVGNVTPELQQAFSRAHFNAQSFTDSRSRFQYFNLVHLWNVIDYALNLRIDKLNVTSEPISAAEVTRECLGWDFNNMKTADPFNYDLRSIYAEKFDGSNGYLYDKSTILAELRQFLSSQLEAS